MTIDSKRPVGRPKSVDPANKQIKVLVTPTQHAVWIEVGASKWLKNFLTEWKHSQTKGKS